jgi:glycosyltransferase involved in cell wall biosynthesis
MPWGDGYNTAMLEAMRMGMAVVTVENPSSPIIHGVNGLVGKTEEELLEHIYRLRTDHELVKKLGQAAIQTIERDFSEANFISVWRSIIEPQSPAQKAPAG